MTPDLRLLTAAAAGDDEAYTRWLQELRPQLVRYAADRLAGDRAEAEDVVQDAAMRGLVALRRGRVPANPRAWMYVIVRNRCHDVRGARRAAVSLDEAHGVAAVGGAPDEVAASRRQLAAVVGAIGELPEAQRRVLVSATLEGRPYEEIAAREATSVQAVKSLVHRARRGLAASGARAAALVPGLFTLRARGRGLGGGASEGLAGLLSQHGAAVASVAVVAAAAVPVTTTVMTHRPAPRAAVVQQAAVATAPGVARDSAAAVAAACAAGRPLDEFTVRALLSAKRRLPTSDAEYGDGCSGRITSALRGAVAG